MADLDLITIRRRDVLKIAEEAQKALAEAQAELAELDVAGKTLARLTGGEWPPAGEEDSVRASTTFEAPKVFNEWAASHVVHNRRGPNVTDMLMQIFQEALRAGTALSMTPKEMRVAIKEKFDFDVRSEYMSTTMWRLAQRGKLKHTEDGFYRLPSIIARSLERLSEADKKIM